MMVGAGADVAAQQAINKPAKKTPAMPIVVLMPVVLRVMIFLRFSPFWCILRVTTKSSRRIVAAAAKFRALRVRVMRRRQRINSWETENIAIVVAQAGPGRYRTLVQSVSQDMP